MQLHNVSRVAGFIRELHLLCGSLPAEEDILSSCGSWGKHVCVMEVVVFLNTNLMPPADAQSPFTVVEFYTAAVYT